MSPGSENQIVHPKSLLSRECILFSINMYMKLLSAKGKTEKGVGSYRSDINFPWDETRR